MQSSVTLNSGFTMPLLGLGTWESPPGQVSAAVKYAINEAGYRHIDCAHIYENEPEIGKAFSEVFASPAKREETFITSKLWNTEHRAENVEVACKKTLANLQLEYLDLYLIHWGVAFKHGEGLKPEGSDGKMLLEAVPLQETWQAMESLVEKGLVKSIGVANFTTPMLLDLDTYAKLKPAVNQIELHPYNSQTELVQYCLEKNIRPTAYSPLGRPGVANAAGLKLLDESVILDLAKKHHKKPSQVILNWAVSRGTVVIPKSVTPERILENSLIFDFELLDEEKKAIDQLNKNLRFVNPLHWGFPYFG